jgi:hypothetical protein
MLFYNLSGQIQFRTADQPWGPFSAHGISFDPTTDQGFTNFIYLAGANDTNLCQPNVTGHDLSNSGGVYGPYIFNAFSAGSASETNIQTTLYHTMSTWNPYNSVLMRAIFKRRPPPTIYTGARVTNSVSTASPGGADAFVFSGTNANSNYGTNLSLLIKNNGTNVSNFSRKAYLRFPLSLSSTQRVCSGSLTLTISGSSAATVPFTYNVYGLRSSSPGQSWGETNITWNNAPANDTNDAEALDLNQTIFLGSFTTSTNRPVGAQFSFSSLLLNDFLNQTTNGPLTLIISRLTVDSATEPFGARESAFQPPTLSFVTVPRLPNLSILQNSTAGPFSFNVDSTVTNAGSLTVTGGSSNTNLVPKSNIVLGGSATNRTVTITPATNQTGTTTITLTVSDGIATTDSASFQLSVVPTNRPTLIGPQRTNGQFQFFINSATGSSYVIQSSSNLKAWVSVQTNSAPGSFTDPGPAVGSAKFFRVFYTP